MTFDVDVIVAGAGPAGLLVAGELVHAGVSCALLERRPGRSGLSRARAGDSGGRPGHLRGVLRRSHFVPWPGQAEGQVLEQQARAVVRGAPAPT